MDRQAIKGICSNCKVCKAYLREVGRGRIKHVLSIRRQPESGLLAAEKLLQTEDEISACPIR